MARGRRRVARETAMRAVLARWERSGLPLSRFAEREGLGPRTLYRWRRRLGVGDDHVRRGRPPGAGRGRSRTPGPAFTEVRTPWVPASPFEVHLGDGTMVRIAAAFDPAALRTLLTTLRAC